MTALPLSRRTFAALDIPAKLKTGYSKANVAEDVRQVVQSLGFETIGLVGTDIGAMVAYSYAASHPQEIRHLVFAESLIPRFGWKSL